RLRATSLGAEARDLCAHQHSQRQSQCSPHVPRPLKPGPGIGLVGCANDGLVLAWTGIVYRCRRRRAHVLHPAIRAPMIILARRACSDMVILGDAPATISAGSKRRTVWATTVKTLLDRTTTSSTDLPCFSAMATTCVNRRCSYPIRKFWSHNSRALLSGPVTNRTVE